MGGWDDIIKGTNGSDIINGGSGDDFLQGRAGGDFLDGGDGNDQLQGNEGDDYLRGAAGNDFLHGGTGTDTAVYSGSILHYSFSNDGENLYVNHTGGSMIDGYDRLISIERLVFADAVIDLTQNNAPIAFNDTASTDEDVGTYSGSSVLANDFDWENDTLTATPGTFTGVYGTLVLNADGTYTYTPYASNQALDDGETVQDSFNYTVSDGSLSDTGTLTITIAGKNDAPVANDDTASTSEDASTSGNVLANDTDVDVETLTVANPGVYVGAYGTLTLAADGSYTYTPGANAQPLDVGETAQDVFTYTASDGTASDTATLTVTVTGLNDAPVANDDTASTSEDASVSGNVLANDTDVDVETLTVANPGTYFGAYGTLTLAADGSYTYTPGAAAQPLDVGEQAQDVFTYIASDGTASDTATLTVTVTGANDAPVANDDTASTNEDSSVSGNVLANDTDVDGEPLTVANPGTYVGAYGTLTVAADGSYTYTPGAGAQALDVGESAQDVFTYTASDGTASDTANLTVTVTGLNDAPVANDDTNSTDENSPVSGNVLTNDTDVDGETLTVVNANTFIGAYGTLVLAANGSYTYTPGAAAALLNTGQTANDVFTYIASDGTVSDTATLTITVSGLSGAPNANDDTASTTENSSVSGNVLTNDTDPEGDTLTVSDPGTYVGTYGTLTLAANGSYTFAPNAAADGLAAGESVQNVFSYTATDGSQSDTATLTVTVNGVNDAPTIDAGGTDASGAVTELPDGDPGEGTTVHTDSGAVAFDDVDVSDTHSASFTPQGAFYLGTFSLDPVDQPGDSVGWDFTVSDAALEGLSEGEIRIQTYTVQVSDGNGGTASQNVTITITGAGVGVGPQTVWFIDNSAVGSTNVGTSANPYISIAAFNAAQGSLGGPQPGHTVHLLAGTGTGVYAEADGINLLNGQILVGDATGPIRPTIEASAGDGINVAQNNNVSGIDIGSTSGAGIADSGGSVGTLTVSDVGKTGAGQIVDIDQGGTLNVTLNYTQSTGSSGGAVDLNGVGGTFTAQGWMDITGAQSGGGIDITNSSVVFTLAGGGAVFNTTAANGVSFVGNTGSFNVTGGLFDVLTTSGTGLLFENGGTVSISGSSNNVTSVSGSAVVIRNASSGGVTLESVTSFSGSANAIILDNAGSGGFTVTGLGGAANSGGTLSGKTGADGSATAGTGVWINNTSNVSLAHMVISANANGGIVGTNVTNFTLTDSTLTNNGSTGTEGAVKIIGLTGTADLLGNVIGGSGGDNVHVVQTGGNLDLEIADSGSTQAIMGTVNNVTGNDSVFVQTTGSASLTLDVDGVDFQGARGDLLQVVADALSTQDVTISNNNFNNTQVSASGGGVTLGGGGAGSNIDVTFEVIDNSFTGAAGDALAAKYLPQAGQVRGNIEGNTIGVDDDVATDQGSSGGSGIVAILDKFAGAGTASFAISIVDNNIADIDGFDAGIYLRSSGGGSGNGAVLEATVEGNEVDELGDNLLAALWASVGGSAGSGDFSQLGLALDGNTFDASDADFAIDAIYLDQLSSDSHFYVPGYTGSANGEFAATPGTASADLSAFWAANNTLVPSPFSFLGGVDASVVSGLTGDPFILPVWP